MDGDGAARPRRRLPAVPGGPHGGEDRGRGLSRLARLEDVAGLVRARGGANAGGGARLPAGLPGEPAQPQVGAVRGGGSGHRVSRRARCG